MLGYEMPLHTCREVLCSIPHLHGRNQPGIGHNAEQGIMGCMSSLLRVKELDQPTLLLENLEMCNVCKSRRPTVGRMVVYGSRVLEVLDAIRANGANSYFTRPTLLQ